MCVPARVFRSNGRIVHVHYDGCTLHMKEINDHATSPVHNPPMEMNFLRAIAHTRTRIELTPRARAVGRRYKALPPPPLPHRWLSKKERRERQQEKEACNIESVQNKEEFVCTRPPCVFRFESFVRRTIKYPFIIKRKTNDRNVKAQKGRRTFSLCYGRPP